MKRLDEVLVRHRAAIALLAPERVQLGEKPVDAPVLSTDTPALPLTDRSAATRHEASLRPQEATEERTREHDAHGRQSVELVGGPAPASRSREHGQPVASAGPSLLAKNSAHDWPGVHELLSSGGAI